MVIRMPGELAAHVADFVLATNWPDEVVKRYDAASLFASNPVISKLRVSPLPLQATLETIGMNRSASDQNIIRRLFRETGFLVGAHFRVADTKNQYGIVSFFGDRKPLDFSEIAELNLMAMHLFDQLLRFDDQEMGTGSPLSNQESTCLCWTARGKTTADIARLLGISEHAVNRYLACAVQKLHTHNRTQAVARAVRQGWIS